MNKLLKISTGLTAAAVMIATAVAPVAVYAWSDSSEKGRRSYTLEEINSTDLGNKPIFNSISNSVIGDEKNFVAARAADAKKDFKLHDGPNGMRHTWKANEIKIEENKDYIVRLYVHNNNKKSVAENVTVAFNFGAKSGNSMKVGGYINTSNATPRWYYDDVTFTADRPFRLAYVEGSAILEDNKGSFKLSDNIVTAKGVKLGFNRDGKIPGCFEFAQYVAIKVRPVFDNTKVSVKQSVRPLGTKEWKDYAVAKVGDKMQFALNFRNLEGSRLNNVMMKQVLPNNVELIPGSVKLYNTNHKKGVKMSDNLFTDGINVGDYASKSNAIVTFEVKVVDKDLACGMNRVRTWGQVGVNKNTMQDFADLMVRKDCVKPNPQMPATGPATTALSALGLGSIVTAAGYLIASRKK